jgi:hypothetical protein
MPKGGYRKPANPAAVSGPGSLSRRTDGGPIQGAKEIPGGGKYGERKALADMQSGAPMQGNPVPTVPAPTVATEPRQPLTNLFAPTERPDEPVTAGAPVGAGRTPQPVGRYAMIEKYMPELEALASQPDAPDSFKIFMGLIKTSFNQQGA